jgi:HEAT repeat protein
MRDFFISIFGRFFEWPEFLAGLLTGVFVSWILARLSPLGEWIWDMVRGQARSVGEALSTVSTDRYRIEVQTLAQTQHLSRAIFALDEIVIEPRLLAPAPPIDPQQEEQVSAGTLGVLPNLPDWTYLSGVYRSPTISLADALADGANLLITGDLGTGKTTALAYLATAAARRDSEAGVAAELTPVYIHAGDLPKGRRLERKPFDALTSAAQQLVSSRMSSRLPGYVRPQFRQKKGLLLLDGLDELGPEEIPAIADWLQRLQEEFPGNRIVAAGPPSGYDGVVKAGLVPVTMAPWSTHEHEAFLTKWAQAWQQYIIPNLPKKRIVDIDPALITGWLLGSVRGLTPLELTVRVWAAYAGDVRGAKVLDSFQAFIERFLSPNERQPAEAAALSWLKESSCAVSERTFGRGTPVYDLIEAGILVRRSGNLVSFFQPAVGAYLAARAMVDSGVPESLDPKRWPPAAQTMAFLAMLTDIGDVVEQYLEPSNDLLETDLFTCARWLRETPERMNWRADVLRALASVASDQLRSYGQRLRAVHALTFSGDASVAILFRRLLGSEIPSNRVLGALGLGALSDESSIPHLRNAAYEDRSTHVRQAACLGLVGIGTESALEALGQILLEGDEDIRLASAEALACHIDEGYNMLRDAVAMDDLLTRRAAVFGLARVPQKWSLDILDEVVVEDEQWVVRGAAAEAAERRRSPPWKVIPPPEEIHEIPWLVDFAEREGLGVAPGRAALEMLRRALNRGTPEEQLAALETIIYAGGEELNLELTHALHAEDPHLRDAAFEAVWRLHAAGEPIPTASRAG